MKPSLRTRTSYQFSAEPARILETAGPVDEAALRGTPGHGLLLGEASECRVGVDLGCCWSSNSAVSESMTDALGVAGMRSSARRHKTKARPLTRRVGEDHSARRKASPCRSWSSV